MKRMKVKLSELEPLSPEELERQLAAFEAMNDGEKLACIDSLLEGIEDETEVSDGRTGC